MGVEQDLHDEAKKWLEKAKDKRQKIKADPAHSSYLKNIDAYISDSEHFLGNNDLIRAFEAVVWAWAWMEILEEMKIITAEQ
jgi:hypothetical protein